jgi:hypothetical protein
MKKGTKLARKSEQARKRKREPGKEKRSPMRGKRDIESDKQGLGHIANRGGTRCGLKELCPRGYNDKSYFY